MNRLGEWRNPEIFVSGEIRRGTSAVLCGRRVRAAAARTRQSVKIYTYFCLDEFAVFIYRELLGAFDFAIFYRDGFFLSASPKPLVADSSR